MPISQRIAYSPQEAKEALGLKNIKTIYGLIQRGELTARKVGRVYRISASSLDNFMNPDSGVK
jgi:excisionase family DNA binding protein